MKQILRIRWRWFGHPAVPPPLSPPLGDYLARRRTGGSSGEGPSVSGCSNSNSAGPNHSSGSHSGLVASGSAGSNLCSGSSRKFAESAGSRSGPGGATFGATGNSCTRSFSQPECRSSWVSPPLHRRPRPVTNMEPPVEAPMPHLVAEPSAHVGAEPEPEEAASAAAAVGAEENNNHPETDTSSCRYDGDVSLVKVSIYSQSSKNTLFFVFLKSQDRNIWRSFDMNSPQFVFKINVWKQHT